MFRRRIAIIDDGTCGRRIAARLRTIGLDTADVMNEQPAFDWAVRTTWPGAIHDATAICIVTVPARPGDLAALAIMAADMGVEHMVLCSLRGGRETLPIERALRRAPLDHTIIRVPRGAGDDEAAGHAIAALCDSTHLNRTHAIPRLRPRTLPIAGCAPQPTS